MSCFCGALVASECAYPGQAANPPTGCIGPRPLIDRAGVLPYSEIRRERIEWLDPGRIPLGLVTILMGEPGVGKSLYSLQLAARLSADGQTSLVLSAEDSEAATIRPRLEACQARLGLVHATRFQDDDGNERGLALPSDTDALDRMVAATEARLVVIDPIVAYLDSRIDSHKDASVRQALHPLHRLAEAHGCAVLCVLHVNKGLGSDWYRRLSGSGGFGGAARSVLVFGRDPDDPDPDRGNRRVLAAAKVNNDKPATSQTWEIVPIFLPASDGDPDVDTARLELVGDSPHGARSLLTVDRSDDGPSQSERAEDFLREQLYAGPVSVKELKGAAEAHGIAWRTVERAKARLGVTAERAGGLADRGVWQWALEMDES